MSQSAIKHLHHYYLQQMGIEPWVLRVSCNHQKNLMQLADAVSKCVRCPLHETRMRTVFARGSVDAKLMLIGEAPGLDEEQQGLPFVGKAGELLNKMLASIGISYDNVYISNLLKCRPSDNRDPCTEEINQCCDFLEQQISLISPKLILAVGPKAGQFLLNVSSSIHQMRSQVHDYQGIPVIVSYHPAYLLSNPTKKKAAYDDILLAKRLLMSC